MIEQSVKLNRLFSLLKKTEPVPEEYDVVWYGPFYVPRPRQWHPSHFLLYGGRLFCSLQMGWRDSTVVWDIATKVGEGPFCAQRRCPSLLIAPFDFYAAKPVEFRQPRSTTMKPLWFDTDPATEAEMIRLLREAPVSKRFEMVDALTNSAIVLSRQALARRRPDSSRLEILLEWVGLHYGTELERQVRDYLRRNTGADGS